MSNHSLIFAAADMALMPTPSSVSQPLNEKKPAAGNDGKDVDEMEMNTP